MIGWTLFAIILGAISVGLNLWVRTTMARRNKRRERRIENVIP